MEEWLDKVRWHPGTTYLNTSMVTGWRFWMPSYKREPRGWTVKEHEELYHILRRGIITEGITSAQTLVEEYVPRFMNVSPMDLYDYMRWRFFPFDGYVLEGFSLRKRKYKKAVVIKKKRKYVKSGLYVGKTKYKRVEQRVKREIDTDREMAQTDEAPIRKPRENAQDAPTQGKPRKRGRPKIDPSDAVKSEQFRKPTRTKSVVTDAVKTKANGEGPRKRGRPRKIVSAEVELVPNKDKPRKPDQPRIKVANVSETEESDIEIPKQNANAIVAMSPVKRLTWEASDGEDGENRSRKSPKKRRKKKVAVGDASGADDESPEPQEKISPSKSRWQSTPQNSVPIIPPGASQLLRGPTKRIVFD
jgi:hypothetical protein